MKSGKKDQLKKLRMTYFDRKKIRQKNNSMMDEEATAILKKV